MDPKNADISYTNICIYVCVAGYCAMLGYIYYHGIIDHSGITFKVTFPFTVNSHFVFFFCMKFAVLLVFHVTSTVNFNETPNRELYKGSI